ncbi:protein phosphatase 1 regulatory subunit 36-like [Chelonus insularis]|uniref:protein phosphatase 1 regulatory subunit 36-like n=1 Tax=Chelonus insularis TaxID=460826 RepID=UPI0015897816|nr:protein phosphatase 1 regulatory subunit 36-like [Chelonus insularis]
MTMELNQEKYYVWDDFHERLSVLGADEEEEKKIKSLKRRKKIRTKSQIYCPHAYLNLNFLDILNSSQKIKYRKYYYRKVSPNEPDIIILQDIKNLVLYFLITPVSLQFINFLHLPLVDRLLRALIMYFQFYLQVWEQEIMKKKVATAKKAYNPLAIGARLKKAHELKVLRCIIAKKYCLLLLGSKETAKFHHLMAGMDSKLIISQGEKDLRIFETFIQVAHRIVWIALARKQFSLIEVELHRLFRTEAYNIADRKTNYSMNQGLSEEELLILHGPKMPPKKKLLMNTPLTHELLNEPCDYRLFILELPDFKSKDPRINYLKNALLADEDELEQLGIKVGILGEPRINYDITLVHITIKKASEEEEEVDKIVERRRRSVSEKTKRFSIEKQFLEMPSSGSDLELLETFPLRESPRKPGKYDKYREAARKKWISRELNRNTYMGDLSNTYSDTISLATNMEN